MVENSQQLSSQYDEHGYFVIRNYFDEAQIASLREVVLKFHESWKADNEEFYQEEAFNSSLITGSEYLPADDRTVLFDFISSKKVMEVVDAVIPNKPAFMNTQLFFNPVNPQQKDFWHRDCQYDYDIDDQMKVIMETQVLHLRVPIFDEPGMDLIPGTHKRWDNEEEYNVRQEVNGKVSSDNISGGKQIPLEAGDLLVFSADMIHRGRYGLDRLALDILIFDSAADYADYVDDDCLPTPAMLSNITDPRLFMNTLTLKVDAVLINHKGARTMTDTKQNTRISQFRFGQPKESLKLEHVALGALDKDKVRVRIEATNINPSDLLSIYGVGQYKHSHQPPRVPGFEAVGRVVESGHSKFPLNQRVLVATSGTWQNYVDVSPDNLFHIPQHLDNGYACQLYINALTAWVLTTEVAKLTKEDVLIINAGSSAIGKIFSQLSESLGFQIITVTSQPERTQTTSCYVLDANSDLVAQIQRLGLPQPTVAFDAIGGSPGTELIHTLGNQGRFINYGTLSLDFYEPRFFEYAKNQAIDFSTFFLRYWEEAEGKDIRRDKFESMLEHFIGNDIQLDVDRCLPLDEVQTAIDLIESKTTRLDGKIILLPV